MQTGITNVTEKHCFFVKGTLTHLALSRVSSEGGLAVEEVRDGTGPGEAEGWCLEK